MKRIKSETSRLKRWKKIGGGSFILGRRYIKPNQKFTAYEEEIPTGFRDTVILLGEVEDAVEVKTPKSKEAPVKPAVPDAPPKYEVKQRSVGYYNVVDQDGKIVNEKALRKAAAEALVDTLQ